MPRTAGTTKSGKRRYGKKAYARRKNAQAMLRSVNQTGQAFKLKVVGTVASNSSGLINHQLTASSVTTVADMTSLANLFDSFVVHAIKMKLIPADVGGEDSFERGNMCRVVDMDGLALPTTIAQALEYDSFKMFQPRDTHVTYLKIPKRYRPIMNEFTTYNSDNKNSTIIVIGDNFTVSQTFYYFVHTFYITAHGRR